MHQDRASWPSGEGEMAGRIRDLGRAATPLGPTASWPQSLRTAVDMVLAMPNPTTILWGPERVQLYNDAYIGIAKDRHPAILGRPVAEGWPDVYERVIAPLLAATDAGRATQLTSYPVSLRTPDGSEEERVFDTAWSPLRDEAGKVAGTLQTLTEVTDGHRAQRALRDSEERQRFLLTLSDLLRPLSDPGEIQQAAMKLLAENHDVNRAGYLDVHDDENTMTMAARFERDAVPTPPQIQLSDYGSDIADAFRAGCTLCVRDTDTEAETEEQRAAYRAIGVRSWIIAPLVKGGRLIAIVGVVSRMPRDWTPTEIRLVTDLAERTWDAVQRARSEGALRESEERFAQFAASSSDALWVRDAATLAMEYVSPAIETIYGVPAGDLLGDPERWLALIVRADRAGARAHIEQARIGEAVVHEFRIVRPVDGEERWIRNTDFPLRDVGGRVQRIGGIAEDVTEAKHLQERQAVLVAELQHRTRNIMGVVHAIARTTLARSADLADFRTRFGDRLAALARVQGLLSRLGEWDRVTFDELIRSELSAMNGDAERVGLSGPEGVALRSSTVQTFALAMHELATNALKYGALAQAEGRLAITWRLEQASDGRPWLYVDWRESGVSMADDGTVQRDGSGRELIERALPYQLGARTTYVMEADGVHCTIALPVSERQTGRTALREALDA